MKTTMDYEPEFLRYAEARSFFNSNMLMYEYMESRLSDTPLYTPKTVCGGETGGPRPENEIPFPDASDEEMRLWMLWCLYYKRPHTDYPLAQEYYDRARRKERG